MPVLSFEEHGARKKMTTAIDRTLKHIASPTTPSRRASTVVSSQLDGRGGRVKRKKPKLDTSLIEAYLESERPVHCRRTLDQYQYYMLKTTEARDRDQVVYKWARKQKEAKVSNSQSDVVDDFGGGRDMFNAWSHGMGDEWMQRQGISYGLEPGDADKDERLHKAKHWPIVMVDQLWLWILPDGAFHTDLVCLSKGRLLTSVRDRDNMSAQQCGCRPGLQHQDSAGKGAV